MKSRKWTIILVLFMTIFGVSVAWAESTGYDVIYNGASVGVVKNTWEVTGNLEKINQTLSEQTNSDVKIRETDFEFEKVTKFGQNMMSLEELTDELEERDDLRVGIYMIAVKDGIVARLRSLDDAVSAIDDVIERYKRENPEEEYESIEVTDLIKIIERDDQYPFFQEPDQVSARLSEVVSVKTIQTIVSEEVVPYDIVYEETNVKYIGETDVKVAGLDGTLEVTTKVEKQNGEEIESVILASVVIEEPIDQVVLVGVKLPELAGDDACINPTRGTLTSRMGARWGREHKGIDIGAPVGTPIYAVADGVVTISSSTSNGYGNMVKIDHGEGQVTLYAHCDELLVEAGQTIYQGQLIATVGSTGNTTGPHLHFEVLLNGVNVDPLAFVNYP